MQTNKEIMEDPSAAEICVVCCREIEIYAVGSCDHPVCFECSARMRVLCEQNECPICRGDMAYVMFTHKKQAFSSMCNFPLMNKKYMIRFEDQGTKEAFEKLLEHNCKSCGESFDTFKKLEIHVRRQHKMQFCDLCVGSLKIFTFERKVYSRTDLALHKRQGDLDDTSFRGHPLCKFCQTRFVDHDEQFRHLRREHFFCHFCDADGLHQYYSEYSYLKDHFRKDHFLCEEGECAKEQQFISSAFRNKLDLQAHKALKHSRNKTKAEAKQARTLDFEFSFAPRSMQNGERSPNHNDSRRGRHKGQLNQKPQTTEEIYQREPVEDTQESQKNQMKSFNTCAEEFPTLSGESRDQSSNSSWLAGALQHRTLQQKKSEDFPALTSLASEQNNKSSRYKNSFQQPKNPKSPWNDQNRIGKLSQPNTAANTEKNKSSQWTNPKPILTKVTKSEEEFPRLETKKVFQSEVVPKEEPNHKKCWSTNLSSQTAEQLGKEIYEKCKSKKKKKNTVNNLINRVGFEDKVKPLTQPNLTRMYGGISDHNMNGYDENQDPLQAAKAKCLAYERPKKFTDDDDDDVPWHEKPNFIADDFPPLEISKNTTKGPPGFTAPVISSLPPPGFSTKLKSKQQHENASISLKSVAQQLASEDMNSDSESQAKKYLYIQPPCFQERNNLLINMIYGFLEEDNDSFDRFKILSGSFRKERTTVQDYYTECLSIFGREKFHNLFTELICLLPDICKQQELLAIHNRFLKDELKNRGAVPKDISLGKSPINTLSTCSVCMQVLKNTDYSDHMQCHNNEVNG